MLLLPATVRYDSHTRTGKDPLGVTSHIICVKIMHVPHTRQTTKEDLGHHEKPHFTPTFFLSDSSQV